MDKDNEKRRKIAQYYRENIKNSKIVLPKTYKEKSHVWHVFVIRCKQRDKLNEYLNKNNIQIVIHYPIAPHKQIAYKEYNNLSFPITEMIHNEVISLPISPTMTKKEIKKIVEAVNNFKG